MRTVSVPGVLALLSAIGVAGCASPTTTARSHVNSLPAPASCELSLEMWASDIASEPTCIKLVDRPVAFPADITLLYPEGKDHAYCADDTEATASPTLKKCVWNRRFRDTYPLSFRINALTGKVTDRLRMIDVFRNGELAYRWDGAVGTESQVTIAGGRIKKSGVPSLADFDLRLYPSGLDIPEAVLALQVETARDRQAARFVGVAKAAFEAVGIPTALKGQYEALLCDVNKLRGEAALLAGDTPPQPLPGSPAACPAPVAPINGTMLARYQKAKAEGAASLKALETNLQAEIASGLGVSLATVRSNAQILASAVKAQGTAAELATSLQNIDALVQAASRTVDDAVALASDLSREASSVLKDPAKQAELYYAVAREAEDQGDPFDPYVNNPSLTGREVPLPMHYRNTAQWYVLSVWNGAAFRTNDFKTSPSAAYAIPILDIAGHRWKWSRSRWAEVRLAVGAMMFEDRKLADEAEVEAEEGVVRGAVHVNGGFGPYRMGLALVPAATGSDEVPVRVLIGADLYKLLFGQDLTVKDF